MATPTNQKVVGKQPATASESPAAKVSARTNSWSPKCPICSSHGHISRNCFLENPKALESYLQKHPNSEKYWRRKVEQYQASKTTARPIQILKRNGTPLAIAGSSRQRNNEQPAEEPKNNEASFQRPSQPLVPAYHDRMGLTWDEQWESDVTKDRDVVAWAYGVDTNIDTELDAERNRDEEVEYE